jgi:hypothetical protein
MSPSRRCTHLGTLLHWLGDGTYRCACGARIGFEGGDAREVEALRAGAAPAPAETRDPDALPLRLLTTLLDTAIGCDACPTPNDCTHAAELLDALGRYAWTTAQERLLREYVQRARFREVPYPGLEALVEAALALEAAP